MPFFKTGSNFPVGAVRPLPDRPDCRGCRPGNFFQTHPGNLQHQDHLSLIFRQTLQQPAEVTAPNGSGPTRTGRHLRHSGNRNLFRLSTSASAVAIQSRMAGDCEDPGQKRCSGTVGVPRAVYPHPAFLQQVFGFAASVIPGCEESQQERRDRSNKFLHRNRIPLLVPDHQSRQVALPRARIGMNCRTA